jgi:flavin reductase (DIM6/NTAB) family NADH-FMN oxidoreductase RutF
MAALFCCPRPVFLIGVVGHDGIGNTYPFKVSGQLNREFVGFYLEHNGLPEKFVRQTRRVTLSSVPMQLAPIAYSIEQNHYDPTIGRQKIPFATRPSQLFNIPVPVFAPMVRELQVERVRRLRYHTFFLARVVSEEQLAAVPELCVVHGFYQDWRVKHLGIDKAHAAAENSYVSCPLSQDQAQRLATLSSLEPIH